MSRLWVREIKKHRVARQSEAPCKLGDEKDTLLVMLRELDAPAPMWLPKHEREFDEFRRTAFAKSDFVEDVPFDKLEVEYLADDGVTRKSNDPRNDFS